MWNRSSSMLCRRLISLMLLTVGVSSGTTGQAIGPPPAPGSLGSGAETPAVGDPEVAYLFLLHNDSLIREAREIAATNPERAAALTRSAAEAIGVGVADFEVITRVNAEVLSALQAIDKEADQYRDNVLAGVITLKPGTLQQFEARRTVVKAAIKSKLQARLEATAYVKVITYIEGPFRATVRIWSVKK